MKKIYCIIVTYNGMPWIGKCLDCLNKSILLPTILLIDNGSKDPTVSFVKNNYPMVRLITTEKNLGFGQGNNIGLKIAVEEKADHILLLNQDVYVEPDTIRELVEAQTKNPAFGILSPVHTTATKNDFDDHFYEYLVKSELRPLLLASLLHKTELPYIISTRFVNAAIWLISRDCLIKTGGFDPIFFHYGEDDNYAQRVLYRNIKIGILPGIAVIHDKERPVGNNDINYAIKKEWINFLNQPCNIQNNQYLPILFKRFGRHSLMGITSMFMLNKKQVNYHFSLAGKIAGSFKNIRRSRKISLNNNRIPHLS